MPVRTSPGNTRLFTPDEVKVARRDRIRHPVDAILTLSLRENTLVIAFLAIDAGLLWGVNSGKVAMTTFTKEVYEKRMLPIAFVDNEWHDYDHGQHMEMVARFRPKYATTRDYLTERDAERAGVTYYSLDQVLRWAEEVEQYAEHAIVIPKAQVLHEIPERHVLGYSVPTTYGGTPGAVNHFDGSHLGMPLEAFKGRKVHLLGGSWKAQRRALDLMGEDVVSIDFNYMWKVAQRGHVVLGDGKTVNMEKVVFGPQGLGLPINSLAVAMALSIGNISNILHTVYAPLSADGGTARIGASSEVFKGEGGRYDGDTDITTDWLDAPWD